MMAALHAKHHPQHKAGPGRGKTSPPTGRSSFRGEARPAKTPARRDAAVTMNVSPTRAEEAAAVLKANPDLAAKAHTGEPSSSTRLADDRRSPLPAACCGR